MRRRKRYKRKSYQPVDHDKFYETRHMAGLSRTEVACLLHVTGRTIALWEQGKTAAPYAAYKLLRVLTRYDLPGNAWEGSISQNHQDASRQVSSGCTLSFDIIYFDACGPLPSSLQATLRTVSNIFRYPRRDAHLLPKPSGYGKWVPPLIHVRQYQHRRKFVPSCSGSGRNTGPA